MIPLKDAIENGLWLQCEYDYRGKFIQFRLKILSFLKIKLSEIDEPEKIKVIDSNANYWQMDIEVINLTKEPLKPIFGPNELVLVDQDGFKFHLSDDDHLRLSSEFAKRTKMNRFYATDLIPKTKAIGAIAIQLPEDDDAFYSISLKDGIVREA
ncbi:MAG: hypothetical protein K9I84_11665 [Leadbetterella sp.]|nr:hypothetical protein [Leadbetterella sp.]